MHPLLMILRTRRKQISLPCYFRLSEARKENISGVVRNRSAGRESPRCIDRPMCGGVRAMRFQSGDSLSTGLNNYLIANKSHLTKRDAEKKELRRNEF